MSREFWNKSKDWSDCHSDERTRYVFTERFSPRPSSRSSYYDPAAQSYGDHRLNSSPKSYHGHRYFSPSRNNTRSHTEEWHHRENLSYQGQEPSCYSSNNVWERPAEERNNPENWSINSRNCYSQLEPPSFEPESWRSRYQEHSHKEFPPLRQLESRLTPTATEQPYTTQSRPHPFNNSQSRSRNNRSRRLSDRDSSVKDPIRERLHSSRDLSQRESSFHRERSSRRPQDRELARQKSMLHVPHQDWHPRKASSRQLHRNLPLHWKSSRELSHRDRPLYREPSYRELPQEEQSLHREPLFRDPTPRDTRDQSQRDTYLYREPQQVDPPLHTEPLFRGPLHMDPPLHREPLFREPPHLESPLHREPLFRELPYMDPPLQREPSSNELSYDPSFIEDFSVSTRDYSGMSEEQQQEDSEHEGVTTEHYNDDFQTISSHNMSWRARDSSEDFFDEKTPNLLPYTQCYRNDLTEPVEPSVFTRLDHHSPVIMERASVLTRLGCPHQSSPPRNYSGSPSLPDLRDELVAWQSVSSGGSHNMQTDPVSNVSSHHVSLRHNDSLANKDLDDDVVIMSPELTTAFSLDNTLSSGHTSHHLPFRPLSSLENIPQECYIKEEENGILPVHPLFTLPISSVTPPHFSPCSLPPPIDSPVTPSLIIDTSLTSPPLIGIPVSSLSTPAIDSSTEVPFPITNTPSSVVRTSITTPASTDTSTTLTPLVSSHVNTLDATPVIMTPNTIPQAVTTAVSPLMEIVPCPILDTPVDAPSLVRDAIIVSFHGNSTSSLPETEAAIVPPPPIDSPSDAMVDISSLTNIPAVIPHSTGTPTSLVEISSSVTPAILPLVDTTTTVPFLLDTSTNISPLVDTSTNISPLVDTSTNISPLVDTSTAISPLVDTSATTPPQMPITSSSTPTCTRLSTMNKSAKLLIADNALVASNSNNIDQSSTESSPISTISRLNLPCNVNADTNIINSGTDLTMMTFTTGASPTQISTNTTGANSSVVYTSSTYTNETSSVDKAKLCPPTVDVVFNEKDQASCSKDVSDSLSSQPTTITFSDSVFQVSTSCSNIPSNTNMEESTEQLEQITNGNEVLEPGEIISDEEEGELTPTPPPSPSNSPKHVSQSTMCHSYQNYENTSPSFSTTRKQSSYRPTHLSRNNRTTKNWFHYPRRSHHYRKFPALQTRRKRRERHRNVSDTEEEELELLELRRKALLTMVDRRSNNQQQEKEKQEQVVVVSEDTCNTIASEVEEIQNKSPGKHLSTENQPIDVRSSDSSALVVKVAEDEKISEPKKSPKVSSLNGKLGSGQHSSVKVVTSLNNTWNVKDFRIVTSDLESDDEEKDEIILPTNVDQMIDVCRKAAESKATVKKTQSRKSSMKLCQSKLSLLTMELTECENESKTLNTMILSLSEQLKGAKHKLQLCEDRKSLTEQEISKVKAQLALEQNKQSSVDPDDNVSDIQPMIVVEPVSDVDERKETLSGTENLQFEDVSQPSSVKDSPVLSPVEIELVSDYDHGNESGLDQVMVSKPSSPFSSSTSSKVGHKSTNERQQLLQIVTAQTQRLAQVKQNYLAILKKKATLRKKHISTNKRSFVNVKAKNKGSPKSLHLKPRTSKTQSKTKAAYPLVDPLPSQSVNSSKPLEGTSCNDQISSKTNTNLVKSTDKSEQLHLDIVQVLDSLGVSSLNKELVIDNIKKWQPTRECQGLVLPALIISPLNIITEKCFQSFDPPLFPPKLPQEHLHTWLNVDIVHTVDNNLSKSHFTEYQSPLLVFKSYRLNPLYRTLLKRPLGSLTHSHSVDPHNPFCHFEIQGKCHNPSCTGQHWDNICVSTEHIVKELLSYSNQAQNLESRLRSKMSDNEWLVYTAHDVYQNLGHKRSLISASECWLDSTKNSEVLWQKSQPANGQDLIPMPLVSAFQFQPSPKREQIKNEARYFKTTDKEVETCTPDSILKQVSEQDHQGNQARAVNLLKEGVDLFPDNEILWVEYLRHNGTISNEDQKLLFSKAIACLPSYAVFYEIISLSKTVEEKKQWIMSAYQYESLCEQPMTKHTSHHLLELVLSYVQLEYLQGHSPTVLSIIFSEQQKDSIFKGIPALLSIEDCVFLGLCHLYLLVTHSLPFQVIGCHRNHVPVRLGNKESFFIPWRKDRMSESEIDVFMSVFKTTLKSCTLKDNSIEDNVRVCLPLYLNLFLFEVSQGRENVASQSLNRLVEVAPSILELKLFQLILAARGCCRRGEVFEVENWMTQSNQEPLLYYTAARVELRQASEDAGGRAIRWLVQCVHSYYNISEDTPVDPGLLYRKLLGQYIPYNLTIPPFADGIHSSLESQFVPLWLCYCLFTELTTPPHLETVEDLFEVAIHSIHPERKGYGQLWLDYLVFLACKATSVKSIKRFFDVVQRSLSAIPSSCVNTYSGKDYVYQDWTYHDNVIQLIESCITHTEDMMKVFTYLLQQDRVCDPVLMLRYLECCLKCDDVRNVDVLATTASYASSHSCSLQHWLLVIANETKLLHYRQARWFYHQITQSNPLNIHLWNQFLMFELTGLVHGYSNLSLVQVVISQCKEHNADLMMTLQVLSNESEKNR